MEADLTEKMEDVTGKKRQPDVKRGARFICSAGVYVFLFFLVGVYSFYAPEGYIQIATNKYLFFRKLCLATAAAGRHGGGHDALCRIVLYIAVKRETRGGYGGKSFRDGSVYVSLSVPQCDHFLFYGIP